jgi:hypothetical protein
MATVIGAGQLFDGTGPGVGAGQVVGAGDRDEGVTEPGRVRAPVCDQCVLDPIEGSWHVRPNE